MGLLRDYPISSFLFWLVEKENVKDYKFYEFLRNYHERDKRHNPKADINGEEGITAVLDGQQRLTSIYIALKGTYAYKLPRKRWDNDQAYPVRKLYLNLVKQSEDTELEFSFRFLTENEAKYKNENNYWFPVSEILNLKEPGDVSEYLTEFVFDEYSREARKFANKTLFKFHNIIHITPSISYYQEKSQSLDKVLNIFIRINSGGTILSYSDLLLSIATAQWEEKDAREEIIKFVDEINSIGSGFNFNKDFILKACLVMSDFSDIAFKVDNFNKANMLKIEQNWEEITKYIRLAIKLLSSFGYNRETLTSNNAVIPIAYYLYKIKASDNYHLSNSNLKDKEMIRKWLTLSLIKRVFSGQPDNVLRTIRKIIKEENYSLFPLQLIIDKFKGTNKSLTFSNEDIENLTFYKYGQSFTFSVLSLLYPQLDYSNQFHIDHIFPKSLFSRHKLRKKGIKDEEIDKFIDSVNYLGNLQLLEAIPNIEKKDTEFKIWLDTIYKDTEKQKNYRAKHYIPNVRLDFDNFLKFFEEREKSLLKKFKEILIVDAK